ncbi:hypothetical protein KKA39_01745 [Patescibacteria group bacterium]|nr:hypothetical protein [Patescibacteria group bacterium]MBU1728007.1 hypothetical protein [Patescibacteria group bacterium]
MIRDAKEASHDPVGFGSRFLVKKARGMVITVLVIIIFLLGVTFIFGYTSLIAGPYGIVKFLFWIFAVPSFLIIPFLVFSIRTTTKALNSFPKKIKVKEV